MPLVPLPSVLLAVGVHWQKWPGMTACGVMIEPHRRTPSASPVSCLKCLPLIQSEHRVWYAIDVTFEGHMPAAKRAGFLRKITPDRPFTDFDAASSYRSRLARSTLRYMRELGAKPTFVVVPVVAHVGP